MNHDPQFYPPYICPLNTTMQTAPTFLKKTIIHFVGSKNNLGPLYISGESLALDEEATLLLQESFLQRFRDNTGYHAFSHPSSLQFNETYQYCRELFGGGDFETISASIARHLYEQSTHPKVKGGELYIAFFLKGYRLKAGCTRPLAFSKRRTSPGFWM